MNGIKTTMLLAALTALFMALGYTLGGSGGAVIALLVAAGMNLFTFWNADKIVLKMAISELRFSRRPRQAQQGQETHKKNPWVRRIR